MTTFYSVISSKFDNSTISGGCMNATNNGYESPDAYCLEYEIGPYSFCNLTINSCQYPPICWCPDDCDQAKICENYYCVDPCSSNEECQTRTGGAGSICNDIGFMNATCEYKECGDDLNCNNGHKCSAEYGSCHECLQDSDCDEVSYCDPYKICEVSCEIQASWYNETGDEFCQNQYPHWSAAFCSAQTQKCQDANYCSRNDHCDVGYYCEGDSCHPGCLLPDGPNCADFGFICVEINGTGICESPVEWLLVLTLQDPVYGIESTDFGQYLVNNLFYTSPLPILYRYCPDCRDSHKHIFYKRYTLLDPIVIDMDYEIDLYSLTANWVSTDNELGIDFDLFSSIQDALNGSNPWTVCNYDAPQIGMFGDCGPNEYVFDEWTSRSDDGMGEGAAFYIVPPPCPGNGGGDGGGGGNGGDKDRNCVNTGRYDAFCHQRYGEEYICKQTSRRNGVCKIIPCDYESECKSLGDYYCDRGYDRCRATCNVINNSPCYDDEICVNGRCQKKHCANFYGGDAYCQQERGPNYYCYEEIQSNWAWCRRRACNDTLDCQQYIGTVNGSDYVCDIGQEYPFWTYLSHKLSSMPLLEGECIESCKSDRQCVRKFGDGYTCNVEYGLCLYDECHIDSDCTAPENTCFTQLSFKGNRCFRDCSLESDTECVAAYGGNSDFQCKRLRANIFEAGIPSKDIQICTDETLHGENVTECVKNINYVIDGQSCIIEGDPHFITWDGIKHDFQGQPGQKRSLFYYLAPCFDVDPDLMPFRMMGKHEKWGRKSVSGVDYVILELFGVDDTYYIYLSGDIAAGISGSMINDSLLYDDNIDKVTPLMSDTRINIGDRFSFRYTKRGEIRTNAVLTIDNECKLEFYMEGQSNFVRKGNKGRYRMQRLFITPPECYRCYICGLCGDFKSPPGNRLLETCTGGTVDIVAGWKADNAFAYDLYGNSWERDYCLTQRRRRLIDDGEYVPDVGDSFNYIDPCDADIADEVAMACLAARDEIICCQEEGLSVLCDALVENCKLDACVASGSNSSAIDENVADIFEASVDLACSIPAVVESLDPIHTIADVTLIGYPTIEPTAAPTTPGPTEGPIVITERPTVTEDVVVTDVVFVGQPTKVPIEGTVISESDGVGRSNVFGVVMLCVFLGWMIW